MKLFKCTYYFAILLLAVSSGCAGFTAARYLPAQCDYEAIFRNNEYIPLGIPCDGTKSGYRHGWVNLNNTSQYHSGIDIAAPRGTAIHATATGTVVFAGFNQNNGLCVKLRHRYGFETIYSHCSKLSASRGQRIKKGQLIARVGATGVALDNVLQYEIYVDGVQVDPEPYLSNSYKCVCSSLHCGVLDRAYKKIDSLAGSIKSRSYADSYGLTPGKIAEIMNDKTSMELLK